MCARDAGAADFGAPVYARANYDRERAAVIWSADVVSRSLLSAAGRLPGPLCFVNRNNLRPAAGSEHTCVRVYF